MQTGVRSHLMASIVGGVIVAGGLLAFGAGARRNTQTIVEEAPVTAERAVGAGTGLTLHAIYERESPAVVRVSARMLEPVASPFAVLRQADTGVATASGFLVDRRGDIMTAYHVIDGASRSSGITVSFRGGVQRPASVVKTDPADDVAVLRVDMRDVPPVAPLPLGSSTSVRIGDPALAMGDSDGIDRTLSSGIVSSLEHQLTGSGSVSVDNVIQTDLPLDPAAAGGPLLDAAGRVIGVDSELIGPEGTPISFATPIDTITPMLRGVKGVRRLEEAYLGLSGVRTGGAHPFFTITGVTPGGPARGGRPAPRRRDRSPRRRDHFQPPRAVPADLDPQSGTAGGDPDQSRRPASYAQRAPRRAALIAAVRTMGSCTRPRNSRSAD